jgi:hypothetical protein
MDKAQETDPVIDEIKNLQMEALSPIQAWQTLKALQDKLEK